MKLTDGTKFRLQLHFAIDEVIWHSTKNHITIHNYTLIILLFSIIVNDLFKNIFAIL